MYVCLCNGVTDSDVLASVREGANDFAEVVERSGAGARCGGCHGTLLTLLRDWGIAVENVPWGDDGPSCGHLTCPRLLGADVPDCASQAAGQN